MASWNTTYAISLVIVTIPYTVWPLIVAFQGEQALWVGRGTRAVRSGTRHTLEMMVLLLLVIIWSGSHLIHFANIHYHTMTDACYHYGEREFKGSNNKIFCCSCLRQIWGFGCQVQFISVYYF